MFQENDTRQDAPESRRGFLAKATELVAAVPLAGYAATNWNKQDQYQVLELEDARIDGQQPEIARGDVERVFAAQANLDVAAEELYRAYRKSYHKSYMVPVTYSNGKTTSVRMETRYYWDVPDGLTGHSTVSSWSSAENSAKSKINSLKQDGLIDIRKLGDVAIQAKHGSDTARHVLTAFVYGSSIGMLWGYEEALAYAASSQNGTTYRHERYEKTTATQETRRGFIKIGAAILGAGAAALIHNKIQTRLSRGEERLEGEIRAARAVAEDDVDKIITEYLGESVDAARRRVASEINEAERALMTGLAKPGVSAALKNFMRVGRDYQNLLADLNETKEQKAALAYLIKCKKVTGMLESASTSDERIATSAAILEGLGITAAMALVVVPGTIYNRSHPGSTNDS